MLQVFSRFCCSCRLEARYFSDPCQEVEAAKFQILKSFKFYNARMNCKGEFRRPPKQQTRGSIKPGRFAARTIVYNRRLGSRKPLVFAVPPASAWCPLLNLYISCNQHYRTIFLPRVTILRLKPIGPDRTGLFLWNAEYNPRQEVYETQGQAMHCMLLINQIQ